MHAANRGPISKMSGHIA